ALARPLGEGDLGHELGPYPARPLRDRMDVGEGRLRGLEAAHPRAELEQRLAVEPGAHLPRVAQVAVLVVTDQQRAEPDARATGRGETADHELLLGRALELEPVAGAGGHVGRVRPLGYEALPAPAAGLPEEHLA